MCRVQSRLTPVCYFLRCNTNWLNIITTTTSNTTAWVNVCLQITDVEHLNPWAADRLLHSRIFCSALALGAIKVSNNDRPSKTVFLLSGTIRFQTLQGTSAKRLAQTIEERTA